MKMKRLSCFSLHLLPLSLLLLLLSAVTITSYAFESDELPVDDEEFGLEGGWPPPPSHSQQTPPDPQAYNTPPSPAPTFTTRRKYSDPDSDSKIHFTLEHAFGDSDFVPAGTFSARLKTLHHGGQTLTKLRFTRNAFTNADKENFETLLQSDDFYRIRLPSNVLGPPGRYHVISSVKARCLTLGRLDEHFVIHMDGGINILSVNYGAPVACPYPRQMKLPTKWPFNSHAVLKTGEQAPRTPLFAESTFGGENGEVEGIKPPERSFWAKYWMYLIPLGLIVMNAMTQAMNMAEEQPSGQPGATVQRGPGSAARRR